MGMGCEDVLQELVIIGAGGFGREVKWLVEKNQLLWHVQSVLLKLLWA